MKFHEYAGIVMHLLHLHIKWSSSLPNVIRIGVLYDYTDDNKLLELFVKAAIESINTNEDVLPQSKLVYQEFNLKSWESYESYGQVCDEFQRGSMAIIGPQDLMSLSNVKSVCESLEVPHIQAIWDHSDSKASPISLNLYPQSGILSQAFLDAVKHWKWHDVIILYQHYTALIHLQSIIKEPPSETMKVRVINITPKSRIRIMKMLKQMGWNKIIIDGTPKFTQSILRTGLQLEMMNENFHYLITNLDIETLDLEDYKYNGVYMNGFKVFYDPNMRLLEKRYEHQVLFDRFSQAYPLKDREIYTEAAMMYDAIWVLANGLQLADKSMTIVAPNISCKHEQPTGYGTSLFNYLNSVEMTGLTGPIKFKNGARSYFNLDLLELDIKGLYKVGYWTPIEGLSVVPKQEDSKYMAKYASNKSLIITSILRPLIVTTILERPYVMYSKCHHDNSCITDNDHFEGFCMDMLSKLGKKLGFKYKIILVPDGTYGAPNVDGEWTGMIRELMDNRADLSVAPLTINWLREQVVDFTKPFMSLGISILFKLPEKSKPGLFSFLNPLSIEIWLYVVAAFFGISILLFTLARFSPYEWVNTHPPCCVTHYLCYDQLASATALDPVAKPSAKTKKSPKLSEAEKWKHQHNGHKQVNGSTHLPPLVNDNNGFYVTNNTLKGFDRVDFLTNDIYYKAKPQNGLIKRESLRLDLKNTSNMSPNAPAWSNKDISYPSNSVPFRPFPYNYQPPMTENRFTLTNSLWFTLGTLMQQGSDISPSATSTRIVGGVWWFFTLILISSYTANLAAFLTVEKMVSPIESAEDLAEQTIISYGTLASGSTFTFFKNAKVTLFKKMWRFMENRGAQVFTQTQEEGVKRVLEGNYAFFMESTTIDYIIQRNCNLTQIGGLLDSKGYGIGTPLGSPFRDPISLAILEMQENGQITLLYNKWWKNIGVTCHRDTVSKESKASELGLENVGGIFVVLLGGIACSFVVGILEFVWKARKNADSYKQSMCSQLGEELKYAIKCKESRQRPRLRRHCSQCQPNSNYQTYNHNLQEAVINERVRTFEDKIETAPPQTLETSMEDELTSNDDMDTRLDASPNYFNPTLSNFPSHSKRVPERDLPNPSNSFMMY